jgi:hypothetical protein
MSRKEKRVERGGDYRQGIFIERVVSRREGREVGRGRGESALLVRV